MPAKSKAQQRFFGMVRAAQKGEMAAPSSEVSKAASSMSKSDVKKFAKTKHDKLPEKVTEAMNFSEYLEAIEGVEPLYKVEGELPKCPPGYRYDRKAKDCVPKTDADKVGKDQKDSSPENAASYKVWGRTGLNGDGYAWEDKGGNWGSNAGAGMGEASPY